MTNLTRRRFLEDSMLAAAAAASAAALSPVASFAQQKTSGPNDRIRVGVIGCRIRGKVHAREFAKLPGCEVAYVCDPDRDLAAELAAATAQQQGGTAPKAVQDLRRVLEDKSVDVISVAAPNHWHALAAIWAMQAGKDVYVEKPASHNVSEGRRMVQVARKTGRICQTGSQYRSSGANAAAVAYMRAGKLGEVKLARSIVYGGRGSIGGPGTYEIPPNVDYDLWAGPAPKGPLTRPRFHYDWHWFWATGSGELGNNNVHSVDICRWGLGVRLSRAVLSYGGRLGYTDAGETPNTQIVIHDFGDKAIIMETRGLKTGPFNPAFKGGTIFYGSDGFIAGSSLFDPAGKLVRAFEGPTENHFANFIKAVRSRKRKDLNAEIEEGHLSAALCHLGNISYRLGAPASAAEIRAVLGKLKVHEDSLETLGRVEQHLADNRVDLRRTPLTMGARLELEPGKERFAGNADANALLTREYRAPFIVPPEQEIQSKPA